MKIKQINTNNSYKVVLDDEHINTLYGYSQKNPLVLAHLFSYNSKKWNLQDCRLFRKGIPISQIYVADTICEFIAENHKKLELIISLADLKLYEVRENTVTWSTFEGIIPNEDSNTHKINNFFNFNDGKNKLKELYDFWQSHSGEQIETLENKLLQPNKDLLFTFNFLIKELENNKSIKSEEQLSHIIDNLKVNYWEGTSIPISENTLQLLNLYFQAQKLNNDNHKKIKIK